MNYQTYAFYQNGDFIIIAQDKFLLVISDASGKIQDESKIGRLIDLWHKLIL